MKYLWGFLISLLFPFGVLAAGDFQTKYSVHYQYNSDGSSQVSQNVSLTNNTTDKYATQYQLLFADPPKNISGNDSKGPLNISTSPKEGSTLVSIAFNDQVVGKGKEMNFTLQYQGQDAVHNGQVWEILLPGLGDSPSIDDYELSFSVPDEFGQLAFVSPQPKTIQNGRYTFAKAQLAKVGVVAAFGNFQTFGFDIKYQLENPQSDPVYTEIALPADTNTQRVYYDYLEPRPVSVIVDGDGNWIARYDLGALETLEVQATGQVHLLAEPSKLFTTMSTTPLSSYLAQTEHWPVTDPKIQELARKLKTPKEIYDYVVSTLSYDYSLVRPGNTRKGAIIALEKPTESVCTEFTDLFIAIARAAGIPAREINGYAYTTDPEIRPLSLVSDILHAWPQYWNYDLGTWVSIDPTWGNTTGGIDYFNKLDFNHFAFVTHGQSDTFPISAGLYKTDPSVRNVLVTFTPYKEYPQTDPHIIWIPPWQILPFTNATSILKISNPTGQAIYNYSIQIHSDGIRLSGENIYNLAVVPPFSETEIPVILEKSNWFSSGAKDITIMAQGIPMTYNVSSRSYLLWHICVGLFISLIIITLAIIAIRSWGIYIQRRLR